MTCKDVFFYDKEGNSVTLEEWSDLVENKEYCHIKLDTIGNIIISTIWNGNQQRPFETLICDVRDQVNYSDITRCNTEKEALELHAAKVKMVKFDTFFDKWFTNKKIFLSIAFLSAVNLGLIIFQLYNIFSR